MSIATSLKNMFRSRQPVRIEQPQRLHARFDAAQTTNDNMNHWGYSDGLGPNAAASPSVRRILRNRSRYEVANNSFLKGMMQTKVDFTIGRGPRLQMLSTNAESNKTIESAWKRHCRLTRFCAKLRTVVTSKYVDGEGLAMAVTNDRLRGKSPVTLDLRLYECDHLSDPYWRDQSDSRHVDAISLDKNLNPKSYYILYRHPGSDSIEFGQQGRWVPVDKVFHLFREDRPGQRRGIPYTTPSLPLFAIMRRYTLAALHSSEWAAEMNGVMRSNAGVADNMPDDVDQLLTIPWARNSLLTLPFGWDLQQLKAEQPTTTFSEFYKQVLNESARCLDMPFNIAAGNSSEYNMASGRLDQRIFHKSIEIERSEIEDGLTEPYFEMWLQEFLAETSGIAPSDVSIDQYPHIWGYDGFDEDDPVKVAEADTMLWDKGLITDQDYWLRKNVDPDEMYEKLGSSLKKRQEIGAPMPGVMLQQVTDGSKTDKKEADTSGV